MSYTPELKFKDIVTPITGKDGDFYGSLVYQNIPFSGDGRLEVGSLIEVDCSDYDETTAVDEAHAYIKDFFEYENGVKYRVKIWETNPGSFASSLTVKFIGWYDNTEYSDVASLNTILSGRTGGYDFYCNHTLLKNNGFKVLFLSDYYDANSSPTPGITPLIRFCFRAYFPDEFVPDQATYLKNDLHQLTPNSVMALSSGGEVEFPVLNDQIAPFTVDFKVVTDEADYLETLENVGGNMPNPFNHNPADDPHQDNDPSGTGGGDGDYNPTGYKGGYTKDSDAIDFPTLPTGGALATGAIDAFLVNQGTVTQLFQSLWSTSVFDIATWQKIFNEPMEALISLHAIPFLPAASGSKYIHLGNMDFNDTISSTPLTSQYKTIDCGKYTLKPFFGSAMDTSPYCKVEIFLPFIGIREIKPEDCVGLELHLKYNVDVLTGNLTAQLKCGKSVLYKWPGNCKAEVPVSATVNSRLEQLVKSAGVTAVSGGNAAGAAISAAVNVAFTKVHVQRSGDLSGSVGLLDEFLPYLIVHRPVQSLPQNFRKFKGYTSNITATVSSLKGYTEVEHINLSVPGATDAELEEIKQLLSQGVIL